MKSKIKSKMKYILVILLFFYLFCFPQQAAAGVRDGLVLWYTSVLPVLFPFMLLCGIVLKFDLAAPLLKRLQRPAHALLGCSGYGAFVVFTGFFCGFPMGAKLTAELKKQGKITSDEANFLYGFVNNLSPVFIVSYLAAEKLRRPGWKGLFLVNILGSALLFGIVSSFHYRKRIPSSAYSTSIPSGRTGNLAKQFTEIDNTINDSIQNIVRLGAYIVIFSMLSGALSRFVDTANPMALFLVSCVEVSNGVRLVCESALPLYTKYIMLSVIGAFGGLSALMQTISIAAMDLPTAKLYIKSRVTITLLSAILSIGSVLFFCRGFLR